MVFDYKMHLEVTGSNLPSVFFFEVAFELNSSRILGIALEYHLFGNVLIY